MSEVTDKFIIETFRLSRVNIHTWDEFVAAFERYVAQMIEESVGSAPDQVEINVGRARAYIEIRKEFRDIVKSHTDVTARIAKKKP